MSLVERHPLKEKRRANKPLLERKRRARINDSLSDLKHLVLSSLNKDAAKYAKMEKVDILDMTVQFLKGHKYEATKDDYASIYRAGYNECTKEIYQSIMSTDGIDHSMKCRILTSIASNLPEARNRSPPPSPTLSSISLSPAPSPTNVLSPAKKCISAIFNPTTPQRIQRPLVNSPPYLSMALMNKDCYMTYPTQPANMAVKAHYNEPKRPEMVCMEQRYYCNEISSVNTKSFSSKKTPVWRPW